MLADIRTAFAFLTILPIGYNGSERPPGFSFAHFPLVGLLIGLMLAALALVLPLPIRGYGIVCAWVVITGGLHLDGFGDACDALFASVEPVRRLEIMKDPRTGSWAVVGLILLLVGKVSFAGQVNPLLLIVAPVAGRWSMTTAAYAFGYARPPGASLGGYFRRGLTQRQWLTASLQALLIVAAISTLAPAALWAFAVAPLVVGLGGRWASARLGGGLTGDVYGAMCEVTELLLLVGWMWLS